MRRKITAIAVAAVIVGMTTSCRQERDEQLEMTYELAGENADELRRVIAHYDSTGEPEKARAAQYMIRNMAGLATAHGRTLRKLYAMQDTMYENAAGDFMHAYRFNKRYLDSLDWSDTRWRADIASVGAEYLIENIDAAFEMWQRPWNKDVNLDEFCESVLPYRVADEELEPWRRDFLAAYPELLDTLESGASREAFCSVMNSLFKAHNYMYKGAVPSLRPSSLRKTLLAPCSDYTKLSIYICRSLGIPAHFDYTPQWANYPHGHEWCSILNEGEWSDYMLGEATGLGGHLRKCMNALTKVYRRTYAIQTAEELPIAYAKEEVPPLFRSRRQKDVTDLYLPTRPVVVRDLAEVEGRGEYVYLCVYDNAEWNAIGYGRREGDIVRFEKVAQREAVYLPAYYIGGRYIAAQNPIRVYADCTTESLTPDTTRTQTMVLTRKYYETRVELFMRSVRGGTIELSRNATFRQAERHKIPDDAGYNYQTVETAGEYRYIRFRPKLGLAGQMAEMEAYGPDGEELAAKPISRGEQTKGHTAETMTDKNPLTYAECDTRKDTASWIGLDLGRVTRVGRIDYLGRSDDNFIREGEEYQLEYYDMGWRSVGGPRTGKRKTQRLIYRQAPSNALFRLRNLTKGSEVRIFTYGYPTSTTRAEFDNGTAKEKQIWY